MYTTTALSTDNELFFDGDIEKYLLEFSFPNHSRKAEVTVATQHPDKEIFPNSESSGKMFYVASQTDGFHWLHYWLAQEADALNAVGEPWELETNERVTFLFKSFGFEYKREDKETCYLYCNSNEKTIDLVKRIGSILEPRFALYHPEQ